MVIKLDLHIHVRKIISGMNNFEFATNDLDRNWKNVDAGNKEICSIRDFLFPMFING